MKKAFFMIVFAVLATASLYPQDKVTLTNTTIIKMVKARLSDELIIDEIKNSSTRFNISPDSISLLMNNKVSEAVIREMKIVSGAVQLSSEPPAKPQAIVSAPVAEKKPEPAPVAAKKPEPFTVETRPQPVPENKKPEAVRVAAVPAVEVQISSEALSYVVPLQSLMKFYDGEFKTLEDLIRSWDAKLRVSIEEGNKLRAKISGLEKELTGKINADSKGFTEEIKSLRSKLAEARESYATYQNSMVSGGLKMIKEVEEFGSKLDRSISDSYGKAGQDVKKTGTYPSSVGGPAAMTLTRRKINDDVVDYIAPMSVILYFYQNEIASLDKIIDLWNEKVQSAVRQDKEIATNLEPLKKELASLQSDTKKNKKPIAEIKDKISDLEKERKSIAQKMKDDGEDLSKFLSLSCKTVQNSLRERITDIIEEIKYSYQDSFTYKSL